MLPYTFKGPAAVTSPSPLPHQLGVSEPPSPRRKPMRSFSGSRWCVSRLQTVTLTPTGTTWPSFAGVKRSFLHCDANFLCRIKIMKLCRGELLIFCRRGENALRCHSTSVLQTFCCRSPMSTRLRLCLSCSMKISMYCPQPTFGVLLIVAIIIGNNDDH